MIASMIVIPEALPYMYKMHIQHESSPELVYSSFLKGAAVDFSCCKELTNQMVSCKKCTFAAPSLSQIPNSGARRICSCEEISTATRSWFRLSLLPGL